MTYDDYTIDVIENQLLAGAAGRVLLRLASLPPDITARLRRLEYRLLQVNPTPASSSPPSFTWTRLNQHYRHATTLSRLILRSAAFESNGGAPTIGNVFLIDMNKVFEDVVGLGIRESLRAEGLNVDLQRVDHLDHLHRVEIRPDIVITSPSKPVAVADVKYKRAGTNGLATGDLYQAVAYATRYQLDVCTLVYPEPPRYGELRVGNVTVRLASIDLSASPPERRLAIKDLAFKLCGSRTPGLMNIA